MSDTREAILTRLLAIAVAVTGIQSALRNRGLLKNDKRPCIVLLDGDETPRLSMDTRRLRGRTGIMGPQIVQMRPELYIIPDEVRPIGADETTPVGPLINDIRIRFLQAIWADTTLANILGPNGSMAYNGMATDLKSGSSLSGQMKLDFIINYALLPTA